MLKKHGKTITDNKKIAKTINNLFNNIVKNLNIGNDLNDITSQTNYADPVLELSSNILIIQAYWKLREKWAIKDSAFPLNMLLEIK